MYSVLLWKLVFYSFNSFFFFCRHNTKILTDCIQMVVNNEYCVTQQINELNYIECNIFCLKL